MCDCWMSELLPSWNLFFLELCSFVYCWNGILMTFSDSSTISCPTLYTGTYPPLLLLRPLIPLQVSQTATNPLQCSVQLETISTYFWPFKLGSDNPKYEKKSHASVFFCDGKKSLLTPKSLCKIYYFLFRKHTIYLLFWSIEVTGEFFFNPHILHGGAVSIMAEENPWGALTRESECAGHLLMEGSLTFLETVWDMPDNVNVTDTHVSQLCRHLCAVGCTLNHSVWREFCSYLCVCVNVHWNMRVCVYVCVCVCAIENMSVLQKMSVCVRVCVCFVANSRKSNLERCEILSCLR